MAADQMATGRKATNCAAWLFAFTTLIFATSPARAQGCTNPNGVKGDLLFNSTYDVMQGCTARGWMAFHEPAPPDPCITSGTPGTACNDGQTVYAGSWNGSRYYTTTADQSAIAYWGTYGVSLGASAQSVSDGLTNTNTALASIEANPSGSCSGQFNPPGCTPNAHVLCKNLRTSLGGNWYLPANDEILNVLYANQLAIGGLMSTMYWSSTEYDAYNGYDVTLSDGSTGRTNKSNDNRVRCVRRE